MQFAFACVPVRAERSALRVTQFALISLFSGACSIMPDLPPDLALPMREIVLYSACSLQDALRTFDTPQYKRFNAQKWLITVSLSPKVDLDVMPGFGLTRKVPTVNLVRQTTWALGPPGAQLDVKTERSGAVGFVFKSPELIKDNTLPCEYASPTY